MQLTYEDVDIFPHNTTHSSAEIVMSESRLQGAKVLSLHHRPPGQMRVALLVPTPVVGSNDKIIKCALFLEYLNKDRRELTSLDAKDYVGEVDGEYWFASLRSSRK